MSTSKNSIAAEKLLSQVTWYALAALLLTTVHHVYGAVVYNTPWRLHVAFVSGFAATAIVGSRLVLRMDTGDPVRRVAFWLFAAVTLVIPVAGVGLFEGAYNHVVKNALYFAGASAPLMTRMFPPPTYELPNDAFFEITGMLQVVPAMATAWLLFRLMHSQPSATHRSSGASVSHESLT